ncbi:hypothetical protein KC331_g3495 [Hortaea werneckii]|uniref:Myb-like domain-containing protein n=1 Tax=Hortaea werneckii TaxID=91943 RepID=A0A3M7CA69_HORWE|nr:hypothetical protein KC331_g3495 [Hortaea werneckii]KAI7717043.1 hypothetical protein KC353_g4910 [Hortaea werneckii]RMY48893.1 hypothetical protein D0865_07825 [Hortaea werneckii]
MPSSPWNDATDRQLLLTIINLTAPQLPKWDQVAAIMGDGFTAESVRQHFQKMRKDSRTQLGEPTSTKKGGNSTKSTPRKPTKAPNGNGQTPSKSAKRKEASNGPDEADEDDMESPTKKMKAEDDGDDGDEWLA